MNLRDIYVQLYAVKGWFSHLLTASGWFDKELVDAAEIRCAGIVSAEAVGAPDIVPEIAAAGIASSEAVGAPTVTAVPLPVPVVVQERMGGGLGSNRHVRIKPRTQPPEVIPEHWIVFAGGIASQEAVGRPSIELVPMPAAKTPVEWIPVAIKVRKPRKVARRSIPEPVNLTLAPPLAYRDRGAEDDEDMMTLFREAA